MRQVIRAIFENGLFRPIDPVSLGDRDVVYLIVTSSTESRLQAPSSCARADDFDQELDGLLFDGPSLPADFSRADIYAA
jgi:predicted DNA-binding antitoxin AbrB/MazE fold protein